MFAKGASPYSPATGTAGERQRQRLVFINIVTSGQSEIIGVAAQQFVHRLPEQIFAGTINEAQSSIWIECENRDVDLGHDRAQKCGCFERAQALHPQRFTERIDLEQHFAKRVVRSRAAGANRVIPFP